MYNVKKSKNMKLNYYIYSLIAGVLLMFSACTPDEYEMGGKTYYGCETTLDYNTYGIGWINSDYTITADGTVYYEGEAYRNQGYGLYSVSEKD